MSNIEDSIDHSQPFDYAAVDGIDEQVADMSRIAFLMGDIIKWIEGGAKTNDRSKITRMNAFLWCVDPAYFDNISQTELAAKIGVRLDALSRQVCSFRDTFKFRSSRMRSEENRSNSSKAQLRRIAQTP
jgi:hypothetical protein